MIHRHPGSSDDLLILPWLGIVVEGEPQLIGGPGFGLFELFIEVTGAHPVTGQKAQHTHPATPQPEDQALNFAHRNPPHKPTESAVHSAVMTVKRKTTLLSSQPESSKW